MDLHALLMIGGILAGIAVTFHFSHSTYRCVQTVYEMGLFTRTINDRMDQVHRQLNGCRCGCTRVDRYCARCGQAVDLKRER